MVDAINGGDASDRVLVSWDLDRPRVARACLGDAPAVHLDGAPYAVRADGHGGPLVDTRALRRVADALLCATPPDIVAMRSSDPACAGEWRAALREALGTAFARGLVLDGVTRDGVYVLARGSA
jgi:predicted GNAT superfamily acetyltransferase